VLEYFSVFLENFEEFLDGYIPVKVHYQKLALLVDELLSDEIRRLAEILLLDVLALVGQEVPLVGLRSITREAQSHPLHLLVKLLVPIAGSAQNPARHIYILPLLGVSCERYFESIRA
jgi:hypothetical protein